MSTPAGASPGALAVLARIRSTRPEPSLYERCEMCAAPVAEEHSHVVSRGLLFDRDRKPDHRKDVP